MERSAIRDEAAPDFAEPVIGRRFAPTRWLGYDIVIANSRALQTGHALGGEIAEQQADPEQQHQSGRAEFHATHHQRAAAFRPGAQTPRQVFRGHRDHRSPNSRPTPNSSTSPASPNSTPRITSVPPPSVPALKRRARSFADTAITAWPPTGMGVPSPITKVAAIPAQNNPCASANTRTRIAPEQGLTPTAKIAPNPRRQPPGPASSPGSGPWEWPQCSSWTCRSGP